jgi:hypothetical protein
MIVLECSLGGSVAVGLCLGYLLDNEHYVIVALFSYCPIQSGDKASDDLSVHNQLYDM